jgi:hypothetical protein
MSKHELSLLLQVIRKYRRMRFSADRRLSGDDCRMLVRNWIEYARGAS